MKTYIGPSLSGPMTCNCTPARQIVGRVYQVIVPLSDALLEELSTAEAAIWRANACRRWGITNKSHKSHGSNFSSNQTVVNLINDIVTPVQGDLRRTVREAVIEEFGYDIDTQGMA
jgi:hypothetical protein